MATKQVIGNHNPSEEKDQALKRLAAANQQLTETLTQYMLSIPSSAQPNSRLTIYNLNGVTLRMNDTVMSARGGGKRSFTTPGVLFYDMVISQQGGITIVRHGEGKPYYGRIIGAVDEETVQGRFNGATGLLTAIGPAATITEVTTPPMAGTEQGRVVFPHRILRYFSPYIEQGSYIFGVRIQADKTPEFSLEGRVTEIIRESQ